MAPETAIPLLCVWTAAVFAWGLYLGRTHERREQAIEEIRRREAAG